MEKINLSRTLVDLTVSRMLREIQSDPGRSVRKLLDMAQSVSHGRFQKRFFEVAQEMMANEDTAYYEMVTNLVTYADHDKIKTFGMNLGYNGCTVGAKQIRENEAVCHFDIPWNIHINIGGEHVTSEDVDRVVCQGEGLGIYVYIITSRHALNDAYHSVFKAHSDCAFIVLTEPDEVLETILDSYFDLTNCLIVVHEDGKNILAATEELKNDHFLFGTYRRYTNDTIEGILSHEGLTESARYGGTFFLLHPAQSYTIEQAENIERRVLKIRESQLYPFMVIDMLSDNLRIDRIISDSPCSITFDAMGQIHTMEGKLEGCDCNFMKTDLKSILQKANAKERARSQK